MSKAIFCAAAVMAAAALASPAGAHPALAGAPAGVSPAGGSNVQPVQYPDRWQRCRWLRGRAHELEYRMAYAPYWEQQRLQYRLAEIRHELWESCRW